MQFPADFVWGSATSSYQIEGGALTEGRGECIWHRFSHTPGHIAGDDTGDVACDHLHRYRDDVALMDSLGLQAYRFSIAWARVLPQGTGATNPAGLDFYDRLVDELLARQITPYVTLYHWDLPQALQERGGWENRDSVRWFADYADLMSRRLGDRVKHWITHNEPWVVAFLGNWLGIHAPGKKDLPTAFKVAHHLLLSHAAAMPVIRQNVPAAQAGITLDLVYFDPLTDSAADREAAWRSDGFKNRWFLDPTFKGQYPADMVALAGDMLAGIDLSEAAQMAVPMDFLGINYYTRNVIAHSDENAPLHSRTVELPDVPRTAFEWEIYPDGLKNLLLRLTQDYAPAALYITENGAGYHDDPTPVAGVIEDAARVAYYAGHLQACAAAIAGGAPLKGYFAWSLLDNFEWAMGYAMRFGIVFVDFATQQRIPKRSALWYRDLVRAQRGD